MKEMKEMKEKTPKTGTPRAPRVPIVVTAEIIEDSKRQDSGHCMIANAVRAAYPDAQNVAVDIQTIRFSDFKKGLRFVYLTPRVGQKAIIDFDDGQTPEPFSFQLRTGQVALAGGKSALRPMSEHAQAQHKAKRDLLKKTRLVDTNAPAGSTFEAGDDPGEVRSPARLGGKTPPVHTGLRREFGLRAFGRTR